MIGTEDDWHGGRPNGGEELRLPPASELTRQQPAYDHGGGQGQAGPQPQPGERDPEQRKRHPGEKGCQDGLVNVATLEVASGVEKVQLVAVVAVQARKGHHHGERQAGDNKDPPVKALQRAQPLGGCSHRITSHSASRGRH